MEDGIADAGDIMVINNADGTLDKTWQEIHDAMSAGKLCVVKIDSWTSDNTIREILVVSVTISDASYIVTLLDRFSFFASSATGYPVLNSGDGGGNV